MQRGRQHGGYHTGVAWATWGLGFAKGGGAMIKRSYENRLDKKHGE